MKLAHGICNKHTDALAARVYRAYERVFDKFGYPRTVK